MTKAIINLEKRKIRILKLRNNYVLSCDKEEDLFQINLSRFDVLIDKIVSSIKQEWNKVYNK
jgi:hypothetical protein